MSRAFQERQDFFSERWEGMELGLDAGCYLIYILESGIGLADLALCHMSFTSQPPVGPPKPGVRIHGAVVAKVRGGWAARLERDPEARE